MRAIIGEISHLGAVERLQGLAAPAALTVADRTVNMKGDEKPSDAEI
jgi:hypothetical protein